MPHLPGKTIDGAHFVEIVLVERNVYGHDVLSILRATNLRWHNLLCSLRKRIETYVREK